MQAQMLGKATFLGKYKLKPLLSEVIKAIQGNDKNMTNKKKYELLEKLASILEELVEIMTEINIHFNRREEKRVLKENAKK